MKESNDKTNDNTRELVRMLKCWQDVCGVPAKSFWLELLAIGFLDQWQYAGNSQTYTTGWRGTFLPHGVAVRQLCDSTWHLRDYLDKGRMEVACGKRALPRREGLRI